MKEVPLTERRITAASFADTAEPLGDINHLMVVLTAVERLPARLRQVIEAIYMERVSYEELGRRLGCSKPQAWRLARQAVEQLREELHDHPLLVERYKLASPETWQQAAAEIIDRYDRVPAAPLELAEVVLLQRSIAAAIDARTTPHVYQFTMLAAEAVGELKTRGLWQPDAFLALVAGKQRDYGTGNVLAFADPLLGIGVRISDKVARLRNLLESDSGPINEPLLDTYLDIVGYALLAEMVTDGTFTLPLEGNND